MSGNLDHTHDNKSAYNRALQIIRDAAARGDTTIDLFGNKLTALPPEIGQLASLTTLFLSDNQLTSLSPEIGELDNLTDLELGGNQLASLPH